MTLSIQKVRGMRDVLPQESQRWHALETAWHRVASAYGYGEMRLPIIEATGLFKRSIGEITDIVEKEMFSFQTKEDRDSLSLRPEGTVGCVRAGIENSLFRHQIQRLWYKGSMFRHEAPQKGRYRQFDQIGVEAFGLAGPDIDVEHILMAQRFWQALGVRSALTLQINSLGSYESRQQYRHVLQGYFLRYKNDFDPDLQRRLQTNPLRILDSKDKRWVDIIRDAPKCYDYLDADSRSHFESFKARLDDANVSYQVNLNLVRGLDYYNRTVYEWVTETLGAQGTVCAGGRYDSLVEQLGGPPTSAVGFALGVERVLLVQEAVTSFAPSSIDAYLIHVGDNTAKMALLLAEELRTACPTLRLTLHCGPGDFKQQFKKADKSGARIALVIGENELMTQTIGIKFLRDSLEQTTVPVSEISRVITQYLEQS